MPSLFDLTGKVALVTGGGSGLGSICALALAEAGADVAVASRTLPPLQATARTIEERGRRAAAITFDASRDETIAEMVAEVCQELGGLDILLNNAGQGAVRSFLGQDIESFDAVLGTNLRGCFLVAQAVARQMVQQQRGGRIINMASLLGTRSMPKMGAYGISKAGLIRLTEQMALELAKHDITVNALAPSFIETPMTEMAKTDEEQDRFITERSPMRRWGRPQEVGGACVFLASPSASFITGEVLRIDGGWHVW